jgi:hypothetical protein
MIEDGKVQLRRVEYDIDAAVAHLRQSGINGAVLELAESALRTGGRSPFKLANGAASGANGQNH